MGEAPRPEPGREEARIERRPEGRRHEEEEDPEDRVPRAREAGERQARREPEEVEVEEGDPVEAEGDLDDGEEDEEPARHTRRITRHALVPPNPKEFDSPIFRSICLAVLGV